MATDVHSPRLKLERRLAAALGIAIGAAFVETLGSWWSGSLALLSDAGHVGTDAVALGLSLAALRIAERPHTHTHFVRCLQELIDRGLADAEGRPTLHPRSRAAA